MSKKNKTTEISYNKIDKLIKNETKEPSVITYNIGDEDIEITIKPTLNLQEIVNFSLSVISGCFIEIDILDSEGNPTGETFTEYTPYYKTLWENKAILDYYTNLKPDGNMDRVFSLICNTDIIDKVFEHINKNQFYQILEDINLAIEFRKQQLLSNKPSKLDSLFDSITNYINSLNAQTENTDLESFKPFTETITKAYKEGKLDSENLAKAFITLTGGESKDGGDENAIRPDEVKEFTNIVDINEIKNNKENDEI